MWGRLMMFLVFYVGSFGLVYAQSDVAIERANGNSDVIASTGTDIIQQQTGLTHAYEVRSENAIEATQEQNGAKTQDIKLESGNGKGGGETGGVVGRLSVMVFDLDFGFASSLADVHTIRGSRVGNGGYLTVQDGGAAVNGWYVMIDATDMVSAGGWKIDDSAITLVSYAGTQAITTLQGNPSWYVLGVGQQVNLDGAMGYLVMQRTSMTDGALGTYAVMPDFALTIPAYMPLGTYQGTIEVSLYTN